MEHIAKPLKNNKKNQLLFGLGVWDILVGVIIIVLFAAIWIPLLMNKEFIIALVIIAISFLLAAVMNLKIGDFRCYTYIYHYLRFLTTKMRNKNINYVEETKNNVIKLRDNAGSIYEFYRIKGKDVSLLNEEDFLLLAKKLGYFFKENNQIDLLKIDGKINLNKISEYIKSIKVQKKLKDELENNLVMIEKLKNNHLNSTQPKYFLCFPKKSMDADVNSKVQEIKASLNEAELDLVPVSEDEMNDIKDRLYFEDITVDEYSKYLKVKYNSINELTNEEIELRNSIVRNVQFTFRDNYYYLGDEEKFYIYSQDEEKWNEIHYSPFDVLEKKDKYMAFISIKSLPTRVDDCWLAKLFNIKGIDVNFKLKNIDIKNIDKELTRVIGSCEERLEHLNNSNAVKFRKVEEELMGYEALASALADGEEIKNISCIVKLEKDNPKDLSNEIRNIAKILRRQGFEFSRLQFKQFDAIKEFFANETVGVKTNPIECLDYILGYGYPFIQQELIDKQGLYFGLDENETPVFIDWKKMDMYKNSSSMILLGKTGSGKSTTTKRIIKNQMLSNEYKIFVIDPENEYGDMFEEFGGERITMGDEKKIINPFDLNLPKDFNDEEFFEAVKNKTIFLSTFYRIIFDKKINEENIEWLIQKTNELLLATKNKKEITFSDIYKYIKKYEAKKNVIEQFGYYCKCVKGNKGTTWDSKTTINLNNNYIVFEFRELLSRSGATADGIAQIYIVLQYLNNIVLNNRVKNHRYINIIIDEAHLLVDPKYIQVVQFVTEMYKRIRKYNGMMTLITQNVSDFYKPEIKQYSTNLINNAFYIIAHSIKSQEVPMLDELMAEVGGLKQAEKEFLTSSSFGQCILIYNRARTKIKVHK